MWTSPDPTDTELLDAAVRAAESAPSVVDTRPWYLGREGARVLLRDDIERQLDLADPLARELVISCGAALFNVRAVVRAGGRAAKVARLPDPDRPGLLAELSLGQAIEPTETDLRLDAAIGSRRSHRGQFAVDVADPALLDELVAAAATERAELRLVRDPHLRRALAGLVAAAEETNRHEIDRRDELARSVRRSERLRTTPSQPTGLATATDPFFQGRDIGAPHEAATPPEIPHPGVTGTVALLCTGDDSRAAWLSAGQALQRVLLTATAGGVSAAFHTQPLEYPELRAFIARHMCEDRRPQVLLRLGRLERDTT